MSAGHALRLERWLGEAPGPHRIGQVAIREDGAGYALRHAADLEAGADALRAVPDLAALREIVKFDAAGAFRPLRGAPTLRQGWRMEGLAIGALVEALNVLYPTAVADWIAWSRDGGMREFPGGGGLPATEFAETAARQTGMYRITQVARPEQVAAAVREVCDAGCLRRRLWQPRSPGEPEPAGTLPLLCPEACNYFVAQLRERIVAERKDAGE